MQSPRRIEWSFRLTAEQQSRPSNLKRNKGSEAQRYRDLVKMRRGRQVLNPLAGPALE